MSYYIIIRGPLGIGKTTVAQALARKLDGAYISIDGLLAEHGLDKVEEDKNIPVENFVKANEIAMPDVKARLNAGDVVIFDGNFYYQESIEYLVQNLPGPCYAFTLKAPLETCIARDRQRARVYGEGAATAVHNLVSRFDYGITIDTDGKTATQVVQDIVVHLPNNS
jgi:shikimate kinase